MTSIDNAVLPEGSLILVTGANGFVASHIVEQLLVRGYRVRGTTRHGTKLDVLKKRWDDKYPGQFQVAVVKDITQEGAFDKAIKDCVGIVHVASNVSFSTDTAQVVKDALLGTLNILRTASMGSPSVKRFVLTSSTIAIGMPGGDKELGVNDWNDDAVELAEGLSEKDERKGKMSYASSKVQAEKAAWDYIHQNKFASFEFNSVCPAFCLGEPLDPQAELGSSIKIITDLFLHKNDDALRLFKQIEFVSIKDIALLHVGALLLPNISQTRLIGSAHPANWSQILDIFKKHFPQKDFYPNPEQTENGNNEGGKGKESNYDTKESLRVLNEMGQESWKGLEEIVLESVEPFA